MWPFTPRPAPVPAIPEPQRSIFSTHTETAVDRSQLIATVAANNFKTGITAHMSSDAIAMDDAGPGVKLGLRGFGNNVSDAQLAWYDSQSFIGFQTCALLMQHWFIRKACWMPAKDCTRNGWEIYGVGTEVDPKILDQIRQFDKPTKYDVKNNAVNFVAFGRGFGLRIAMPQVTYSDPQALEKPYNPDGVRPGSYRGISQIDPYWVSPLLDGVAASDPTAIGFYEPTYWLIRGQRVHKSHLIISRPGGELPDLLKPTYLYGSVSIPQLIVERVYAAERTANEAPMLTLSKRTDVLAINTAGAKAGKVDLVGNLQKYAAMRNNFGTRVIDISERVEQHDTGLAELDAVIMSQYMIACAIAEVPITRMMGTSAQGLNATGEGDEANYHEFLESLQEHDVAPLLERHYELLIRSEFGGKFEVSVKFNELDAMTTAELHQNNKVKADTYAVLAQTGAIDGQDIRDKLIEDSESGFNTLTPDAPEPDLDEDMAESISKDSADDLVDLTSPPKKPRGKKA